MVRPNETPGSRVVLSYPDQSYTRLSIYATICIISFAVMHFSSQVPGQGVAGWQKGLLIIFAFSAFLVISEAGFLVKKKFFRDVLEFDHDNLYVTGKNEVTTVPFLDISRVRLLSNINRGGRGLYSSYGIKFTEDGTSREVTLAVYRKNGAAFSGFQQALKKKNPEVEFKNFRIN